jgi:hypothetical protein
MHVYQVDVEASLDTSVFIGPFKDDPSLKGVTWMGNKAVHAVYDCMKLACHGITCSQKSVPIMASILARLTPVYWRRCKARIANMCLCMLRHVGFGHMYMCDTACK